MNIHTHNGWEHDDWEKGDPIPDHHTASLMFLHAYDLIPNMNEDDMKDIIRLIENPVNESLKDNENADENDRWRLSGLMFQKTTLVDEDPDNTSLAGESMELNVVNEESDDSHYDLPLVYRRWIPIERIKQMMDVSGVTGDARIPDEVMNVCGMLDIGVGTQVLVTDETCKTFNDLVDSMEQENEE